MSARVCKYELNHNSGNRGARTLVFYADDTNAYDILWQYAASHAYGSSEFTLRKSGKLVIEATSVMGAFSGLKRVFGIEQRNVGAT